MALLIGNISLQAYYCESFHIFLCNCDCFPLKGLLYTVQDTAIQNQTILSLLHLFGSLLSLSSMLHMAVSIDSFACIILCMHITVVCLVQTPLLLSLYCLKIFYVLVCYTCIQPIVLTYSPYTNSAQYACLVCYVFLSRLIQYTLIKYTVVVLNFK